MHIPLRAELTECVGLSAVPSEAMLAVSEDPSVRAAQVAERAFWMRRDVVQEGVAVTMCERLGEIVDLVNRNNEEAER